MELGARGVADDLEQYQHDSGAKNAETEDSDHGKVTLAELVRSRLRILWPAGVQGVRGGDTAQVSKTGYQSCGSCHTNFAMSALKDFRGPRHANWDSRSQAEAHHQKTTVPGPAILKSKSGRQQARNLDADGCGKEEWSKAMKAIRNRCHQENGDEVHLQYAQLESWLDENQRRERLTIQMGAKSKLTTISLASGWIAAMMTEP